MLRLSHPFSAGVPHSSPPVPLWLPTQVIKNYSVNFPFPFCPPEAIIQHKNPFFSSATPKPAVAFQTSHLCSSGPHSLNKRLQLGSLSLFEDDNWAFNPPKKYKRKSSVEELALLYVKGDAVNRVADSWAHTAHHTQDLTWTVNTGSLVEKEQQQQQLCVSRTLPRVNLCQQLLFSSCRCSVESILSHSVLMSFASCTVANKKAIRRIINTQLHSFEDIHRARCLFIHSLITSTGNSTLKLLLCENKLFLFYSVLFYYILQQICDPY